LATKLFDYSLVAFVVRLIPSIQKLLRPQGGVAPILNAVADISVQSSGISNRFGRPPKMGLNR
jgi:hypothetical protein